MLNTLDHMDLEMAGVIGSARKPIIITNGPSLSYLTVIETPEMRDNAKTVSQITREIQSKVPEYETMKAIADPRDATEFLSNYQYNPGDLPYNAYVDNATIDASITINPDSDDSSSDDADDVDVVIKRTNRGSKRKRSAKEEAKPETINASNMDMMRKAERLRRKAINDKCKQYGQEFRKQNDNDVRLSSFYGEGDVNLGNMVYKSIEAEKKEMEDILPVEIVEIVYSCDPPHSQFVNLDVAPSLVLRPKCGHLYSNVINESAVKTRMRKCFEVYKDEGRIHEHDIELLGNNEFRINLFPLQLSNHVFSVHPKQPPMLDKGPPMDIIQQIISNGQRQYPDAESIKIATSTSAIPLIRCLPYTADTKGGAYRAIMHDQITNTQVTAETEATFMYTMQIKHILNRIDMRKEGSHVCALFTVMHSSTYRRQLTIIDVPRHYLNKMVNNVRHFNQRDHKYQRIIQAKSQQMRNVDVNIKHIRAKINTLTDRIEKLPEDSSLIPCVMERIDRHERMIEIWEHYKDKFNREKADAIRDQSEILDLKHKWQNMHTPVFVKRILLRDLPYDSSDYTQLNEYINLVSPYIEFLNTRIQPTGRTNTIEDSLRYDQSNGQLKKPLDAIYQMPQALNTVNETIKELNNVTRNEDSIAQAFKDNLPEISVDPENPEKRSSTSRTSLGSHLLDASL